MEEVRGIGRYLRICQTVCQPSIWQTYWHWTSSRNCGRFSGVTPQPETKPLHVAIAEARATAGSPSFDLIHDGLYARLGPYAPTSETIRVWHGGVKATPSKPKPAKPPTAEKVDLIVLAALADFYDADMSGWHPVVADRLEVTKALIFRSRYFVAVEAVQPVAA